MSVTYNAGSRDCPPEIEIELIRIEEAAGDYAAGETHPCGLVAYYDVPDEDDEDEKKPWRISDDWASECYATAEEAVKAAAEWAKLMTDESRYEDIWISKYASIHEDEEEEVDEEVDAE